MQAVAFTVFGLSVHWYGLIIAVGIVLAVVLIALGTGVGAGVVVNGRLVAGAFGAGGEIGHITVNPNDDVAEAVGIKGNRIVFVGTNEEPDTNCQPYRRCTEGHCRKSEATHCCPNPQRTTSNTSAEANQHSVYLRS